MEQKMDNGNCVECRGLIVDSGVEYVCSECGVVSSRKYKASKRDDHYISFRGLMKIPNGSFIGFSSTRRLDRQYMLDYSKKVLDAKKYRQYIRMAKMQNRMGFKDADRRVLNSLQSLINRNNLNGVEFRASHYYWNSQSVLGNGVTRSALMVAVFMKVAREEGRGIFIKEVINDINNLGHRASYKSVGKAVSELGGIKRPSLKSCLPLYLSKSFKLNIIACKETEYKDIVRMRVMVNDIVLEFIGRGNYNHLKPNRCIVYLLYHAFRIVADILNISRFATMPVMKELYDNKKFDYNLTHRILPFYQEIKNKILDQESRYFLKR